MSSHSPAQAATPGVSGQSTARIGPNSIIQTVRALKEIYGAEQAATILSQGGHARLYDYIPTDMVAEAEFAELVALLDTHLGSSAARQVLERSGQLTAYYLLQHRIPGPFQALLKVLPHRLGLRLLFAAIGKNAWTFVGSGTFRYTLGRPPGFTVISGIAAAEAVSGFYGGTFRQLIHSLIDAQAEVTLAECSAGNSTRCIYVIIFR